MFSHASECSALLPEAPGDAVEASRGQRVPPEATALSDSLAVWVPIVWSTIPTILFQPQSRCCKYHQSVISLPNNFLLGGGTKNLREDEDAVSSRGLESNVFPLR